MAVRSIPGMMFAGFPSANNRVASVLDAQAPAMSSPMTAPDPTLPDLSTVPTQKPGFFSKGGGWVDVIGSMADTLAGRPIFQTARRENQQREYETQQLGARFNQQQSQRAEDRQWQVEDRDMALKAPQFFNSGHDRVRYDPTSGQSQVVYDAPEDYQAYASTLGLSPGDDGYDKAVQDYVLRSSGPTALSGKIDLEGTRQGNRMQLRSTPTFRETHPAPSRARTGGGAPRAPTSLGGVVAPILAKIAQGQTLSPGEQNALSTYQAGRGGHGRGGRTAAGGGGGAVLPTVRTPAEARALPAGTRFKTPDGREMVR